MIRKRSFAAVLLAGILALSFAGCGQDAPKGTVTSETEAGENGSGTGNTERTSSAESAAEIPAAESTEADPNSAADEAFEVGSGTGEVFTQPYFGYELRPGDGWTFADEDQLKELNSQVYEELSDDADVREAIDSGSIYFDFYAMHETSGNMLFGEIIRMGEADQALNDEQLLEAFAGGVRSSLDSQGAEDLTTEQETISVLGGDQQSVVVKGIINDTAFYQRAVILRKGSYADVLVASAYNEDETKTLMEAFSPLA
ncbi:MAG: hypothetical protein UH229_09970 [Lachnospiraceae bacterium]|nr:hypothetical protein [Lachnospiraceae bacterium]